MVYRRRFLSNPYIDFPPTVAPAVVEAAEELPAVAEELPAVAEDLPAADDVPEVVIAAPKAPKRASKAKKAPVAE